MLISKIVLMKKRQRQITLNSNQLGRIYQVFYLLRTLLDREVCETANAIEAAWVIYIIHMFTISLSLNLFVTSLHHSLIHIWLLRIFDKIALALLPVFWSQGDFKQPNGKGFALSRWFSPNVSTYFNIYDFRRYFSLSPWDFTSQLFSFI